MLFGEAASELQAMLKDQRNINTELLAASPKIAKGENYQGLPYLMLDYPRMFNRENMFAFRTMFWWGHFISVAWQLKGVYNEFYRHAISTNYSALSEAGFHICICEDEWRHDFQNDNYKPLGELTPTAFQSLVEEKPFLKLAAKLTLDKWDSADLWLTDTYRLLLKIIEN